MHINSLSQTEVQSKIDALLRADDQGRDKWSSSEGEAFTLTYGFQTSRNDFFPFQNVGNITPFEEAEKESIRAALNEFERTINVRFTEADVASEAALSFYNVDDQDTSTSVEIAGQGSGRADGNNWNAAVTFLERYDLSNPFHTTFILHEIGHAMGLKHPGDYDVVAGHGSGPFLPSEEDHLGLTVMSYYSDPCTERAPTTLQEYDVLALQHFWGVSEEYTEPVTQFGQISGTTGNDTILGSEGNDTISAQEGDDTVHAHCGDDQLRGGAGDDQLFGEGGHDVLYGGAGNDQIFGNAGNDVLYGGAGFDFFRGGGGNDVLIANNGFHDDDHGNTAYYSASAESWKISGGKEYAVLVGPGGERDKLIGIQYIQFGDERVELNDSSALDGTGASEDFIIAERVALLYEAALNRDGAIDLSGLNFYIDVTEEGDLTDQFLANDMMRSPEFAANFGDPDNLSNKEFLERIYLNVLDRPSDAAGRQFYLDLLDDGQITKSLALADIAVSPENAMEATLVLMGLYETGSGEWAFL